MVIVHPAKKEFLAFGVKLNFQLNCILQYLLMSPHIDIKLVHYTKTLTRWKNFNIYLVVNNSGNNCLCLKS